MAHAVGTTLRKYKPSMIRRLHREYVTSPEQPTLKDLSEKYDVKMSYLKWKSSSEHWVQERRNFLANQLCISNPNDNGNTKHKLNETSEIGERETLAEYARRLLMASLPVLVKKAEAGNVPTANELMSIGNLYEKLTKGDGAGGERVSVNVIQGPERAQLKRDDTSTISTAASGEGVNSEGE
jgi:hypothetical protein